MPRVEGWIRALVEHLSRQWLVHLAGGVAVMFAMMLLGFGLLLAYVAIFGSTMLFAALKMESMALVAFFGIGALGSLLLGILHLAACGLWLGWLRIATLRERGRSEDWHALGWPLHHPVRVVGFGLVVFFAVLVSAGMFYLPLIFLGPWLLLSAVSLAADDVGLIAALGRGWRRCGQAYGALLLVSAVCTFCAAFLYFWPLVGPAFAAALVTASAVAVHESLAREEAPGR
jgi:hypothetical protein